MKYDVILRNGQVIDPASGFNEKTDVAITDGKIAAVGVGEGTEAYEEYNVSSLLVLPGLIDLHAHMLPYSAFGIRAEAAFPLGVTTIADAGGAGSAGYEVLREKSSTEGVRKRVLLHVAPEGMLTFAENLDPGRFQKEQIADIVKKYPDEIAGIKIRMGRESTRGFGLAPLIAAREIADRVSRPLVVHCPDAEMPMREMYPYLRAGDIVAHAYHGRRHQMDEFGFEDKLKASRRGVAFDPSDANGNHISFVLFQRALEAGVEPEYITSDVTVYSLYSGIGFIVCLPPWPVWRHWE